MDEIRCPMCGKFNPPELDNCQYCQARLRPLIASQPPEEGESQEFEGLSLSSSEEESLPEWLKDLRSQDDQLPDQEEIASEEELPDEGIGEADWLGRLQDRGEEDIELPGEPATDQENEQIPGWLAETEITDVEQVPDWLLEADLEAGSLESSPTDEGELPEADSLESSPTDEGELSEAGSLELSPTDEGELPEAEDGFEEETPEEAAEPGAEEALLGEIPAWLKDLKEDQAESEPPIKEEFDEQAEEPMLEEAELPEWLVDLQGDAAIEEEETEEFPDWLVRGKQETPPEAEETELADWLAPIGAQEAEEDARPEGALEWIGAFESEEVEEPDDSLLEAKNAEVGQEEPPEWMAELEKEFAAGSSTSEVDEESEPPSVIEAEEAEKIIPEAPAFITEEGEDFLESMPEWAEEVPSEQELEGEAEASGLVEAELPSWLESMRPVESVAPDVVQEEEEPVDKVETRGPLAGLSGILKAESDFSRVRKPPVYSIKLHVTESQEARVALLREMLEAEDKQKPLPARPIITPQYLFRLVIALALIVPIAWAVISGGMLTPIPDPSNVPAGVMDVRTLIDNQLSSNAPVLVAFDYEAGFSSELDLPSGAVLSHMMNKGAFLTLVSTSPSGPILAERMIDNLNQSSTRQGNLFTSYANLGYVPGGTTGLISLAQSPQKTVPYTLDNVVIWDSAPLDRIVSVADFSMVLVITENPETARAWIEQVQPSLEPMGTPLIMVVSAQAGPLVLPYYQGSSKQVQGLLVGFPDGVAYNSLTGQGDLDLGSWDAFSLSMLITEIILVVGAVVGAGMRLFTSYKKEED
jgi:hypothetical protein